MLNQFNFANPFSGYLKSLKFEPNGPKTSRIIRINMRPHILKTLNNLMYYFEDSTIFRELIYESF